VKGLALLVVVAAACGGDDRPTPRRYWDRDRELHPIRDRFELALGKLFGEPKPDTGWTTYTPYQTRP
jgi:hypothetical protein